MKLLITGGAGDLAKSLMAELAQDYKIYLPTRSELDVTSIDSVQEYFLDKSFDVIINNAGSLYSSLVVDSEVSKWINDINVNLIGCYLVTREGLVKNKDVKIINICSTAAFNNYRDWTSYCASKAGVMKLSLGLFEDGYNVIVMCPGAIDTKFRSELTISNDNIMSISEGIKPIVDAVRGIYSAGDVIFYRKNQLEIRHECLQR